MLLVQFVKLSPLNQMKPLWWKRKITKFAQSKSKYENREIRGSTRMNINLPNKYFTEYKSLLLNLIWKGTICFQLGLLHQELFSLLTE